LPGFPRQRHPQNNTPPPKLQGLDTQSTQPDSSSSESTPAAPAGGPKRKGG
jgi:hypothetical protein